MQALSNDLCPYGQTALHLAVHAGSEETVKVLIENGADVNKATDFEKSTPLHIACEDSWKGICKLLIDSGESLVIRVYIIVCRSNFLLHYLSFRC